MIRIDFRAEVHNEGSLSNKKVDKLTLIDKRYYAIGEESFGDIGDKDYYIKQKDGSVFWCNPRTRSINFSDMLDSENNPIFASLNESGKGGDMTNKGSIMYKRNCFWVGQYNIAVESGIKVTGIKK